MPDAWTEGLGGRDLVIVAGEHCHHHLCSVAEGMHAELLRRPAFEALHQPASNILCFRWRGRPQLPAATLNAHNAELRERFNRTGLGWITTTVLEGQRVLRVTVMNPRTQVRDAVAVLDGLAATAAALEKPASTADGRAKTADTRAAE